MDQTPELATVGWCERIDFPDLGVSRIRAKIDTGARTSALGVRHFAIVNVPESGLIAELVFSPDRAREAVTVRAPFLGMVQVRSSSGHSEDRPVVELMVRLGPIRERMKFTLADRSTMRFPVIFGRTALAGRFVVDVRRKYVWKRQRPQKQPRKD